MICIIDKKACVHVLSFRNRSEHWTHKKKWNELGNFDVIEVNVGICCGFLNNNPFSFLRFHFNSLTLLSFISVIEISELFN